MLTSVIALRNNPGNVLQLLGSSNVSFESDFFLVGIRCFPWKETHDPKMNTINKYVYIKLFFIMDELAPICDLRFLSVQPQ